MIIERESLYRGKNFLQGQVINCDLIIKKNKSKKKFLFNKNKNKQEQFIKNGIVAVKKISRHKEDQRYESMGNIREKLGNHIYLVNVGNRMKK